MLVLSAYCLKKKDQVQVFLIVVLINCLRIWVGYRCQGFIIRVILGFKTKVKLGTHRRCDVPRVVCSVPGSERPRRRPLGRRGAGAGRVDATASAARAVLILEPFDHLKRERKAHDCTLGNLPVGPQ